MYSPLKQIECGFGYVIPRSRYTPYSIFLRGTIVCGLHGNRRGKYGLCKGYIRIWDYGFLLGILWDLWGKMSSKVDQAKFGVYNEASHAVVVLGL